MMTINLILTSMITTLTTQCLDMLLITTPLHSIQMLYNFELKSLILIKHDIVADLDIGSNS